LIFATFTNGRMGTMERDADEVINDAFPLTLAVEEAWYEEIRQRVQQIDSGVVELIPWAEARRRLRSQPR